MSTFYGNRVVLTSEGVDATSTGDTVVHTVSTPMSVLRWGFVTTALLDVGAGAAFALDRRVTAGSDTGRVALGTMTVGADIAAGLGRYQNVGEASATATTAEDGSVYYAGGTAVQLNAGDQLVFEVTDAADTAGTVTAWIDVVLEGFTEGSETDSNSRIDDMTELTS